MATNTYVALDKVTVGTAVSSVTFSSINQGYTDLVIVINGNATSDNGTGVEFNGDTGTNYSTTVIYGDGSAAGSARASNATKLDLGRVNGSNSTSIIQVMNYSNTTTYKTTIGRGNTNGLTIAGVGLWRSTAAINAVKIYANSVGSSQNFAVGTTLSLYGVKAESTLSPTAKATGGTITTDQFGYVYHTFTSSGTFTPSQALTCDAMIVAGGGGGGMIYGGGGGAGGVLGVASQAFSATGYTVTIGAGGSYEAGGIYSSVASTNGVDSSIAGIGTAIGGGRGQYWYGTINGTSGGSGGGGGGDGVGIGGAGTSGQGFAGANASSGGGGGGGAGQLGNTNGAKFGGDGTQAYSSWGLTTSTGVVSGTARYYAGGGGGGNGGTGGKGGGANGGSGGVGTQAPSGTANTGGGGGGGGYVSGGNYGLSGSGGSGIVIIRYYGA